MPWKRHWRSHQLGWKKFSLETRKQVFLQWRTWRLLLKWKNRSSNSAMYFSSLCFITWNPLLFIIELIQTVYVQPTTKTWLMAAQRVLRSSHRCWKSRFIFVESLEGYFKDRHTRKLLEQSFFPIAKDGSSTETRINWLSSVLTGVTFWSHLGRKIERTAACVWHICTSIPHYKALGFLVILF